MTSRTDRRDPDAPPDAERCPQCGIAAHDPDPFDNHKIGCPLRPKRSLRAKLRASRPRAEKEREAHSESLYALTRSVALAGGVARAWATQSDQRRSLSLVSPEGIEQGLADLDAAIPALRQLQRELRRASLATVTDGARCRHCDGPMPLGAGAARRYCSRSCRQRAYEARLTEAT